MSDERLKKGDDVWRAYAGRSGYGGSYPPDAQIKVLHGVVIGGGEYMVIIQWDEVSQPDRQSRGAMGRRVSRTRTEALQKLSTQLTYDAQHAMEQHVIIARLENEMLAMLVEVLPV